MNINDFPGLDETRRRNEEERQAGNAEKAKLREAIAEASRLREEQSKLDQRARLEADLRAGFLAANKTANEDDWERLKQGVIDDYMLRQAAAGAVGVFARIRSEGGAPAAPLSVEQRLGMT